MTGSRYLRKLSDGYIYGWTERLAARTDMIECDKDGRRLVDFSSPKESPFETKEIEITGKKFDVPLYLVEAVEGLLSIGAVDPDSVSAELKAVSGKLSESLTENNGLRKEKLGLEADNGELQGQLSTSEKTIRDLKKEVSGLNEDNEGLKREIASLKKKSK